MYLFETELTQQSETYPTISAGLPDPQYMMQYPYAPMGPVSYTHLRAHET